MKLPALSVAASAIFLTLMAGAKTAPIPQILSDNGDIAAINIYATSVAQCTWVTLNTNADFKVICQVYYDDNLNPDPSEPDEINYARDIEDYVNFCLGRFLAFRCNGLSADELVRDYRSGKISATLAKDFGEWFKLATSTTYDDYDDDIVDVNILAVSMRAVGPFAKAVGKR